MHRRHAVSRLREPSVLPGWKENWPFASSPARYTESDPGAIKAAPVLPQQQPDPKPAAVARVTNSTSTTVQRPIKHAIQSLSRRHQCMPRRRQRVRPSVPTGRLHGIGPKRRGADGAQLVVNAAGEPVKAEADMVLNHMYHLAFPPPPGLHPAFSYVPG